MVLKKYAVGDFNFPAIKWKGGCSGDADNDFIECVRDAFLIQMVETTYSNKNRTSL